MNQIRDHPTHRSTLGSSWSVRSSSTRSDVPSGPRSSRFSTLSCVNGRVKQVSKMNQTKKEPPIDNDSQAVTVPARGVLRRHVPDPGHAVADPVFMNRWWVSKCM
jgi:hypothetical protein